MNKGRTVFAQLMDELPKYEFDKCVRRYGGNHRVRSLPTYEQFLVMAFAQLTYRESLRDISTCLGAVGPKLYHSGKKVSVLTFNIFALHTPDWTRSTGCPSAGVRQSTHS